MTESAWIDCGFSEKSAFFIGQALWELFAHNSRGHTKAWMTYEKAHMPNNMKLLDLSNHRKKIEIFAFFLCFCISLIASFMQRPKINDIQFFKRYDFSKNLTQQNFKHRIDSVHFLQRFMLIDLIIYSIDAEKASPLNITTTAYVINNKDTHGFHLFQGQIDKKVRIFNDDSLVISNVSLIILINGNLSEYSHYEVAITYGNENVSKMLISVKLSYFAVSLTAFILFNNSLKRNLKKLLKFNQRNLIILILAILCVANFPYILLGYFYEKPIINDIDNIIFSMYQTLFTCALFYFSFIKNKKTSTIYFFAFLIPLYIVNYKVCEFVRKEQILKTPSILCMQIYMRIFILFIYLSVILGYSYYKNYQSPKPILGFITIFTVGHIILDIMTIVLNLMNNFYLAETLKLHFFNIVTYVLAQTFIHIRLKVTSNNEQHVHDLNE